MARVSGFGECIYCRSKGTLSDEHIIPESLGGKLVLTDSSCEECRKITQKFEEIVARKMYWPLRLQLGIKGKRKHKDRPSHWPVMVIEGDDIRDSSIEVGKLPRIYAVVKMPPPGLWSGSPLSPHSPGLEIQLKGNVSDLASFARESEAGRLEFEHYFCWNSFNRLLAKVAHSYAVSVLGLHGIEFFLPAIVRGASPYFSHYVGGVSREVDELEPPLSLAIHLQEYNSALHAVVRISILGDGRFPTYEVIVGRITDADLGAVLH